MLVVRLLVAFVKLLLLPLNLWRRKRVMPKAGWLSVDVDGPVVDIAARPRLWERRRQRPTSLYELGELVKQMEKDANVKGLLLTLRSFDGGMATATSLRALLKRVKATGRLVVVHLPLGADTKELYIASMADKIYVGPQATVAPLGFSMSVRYVKGALAKAGLDAEVVARGEYKSAGEQLVRDTMSEQQREQLESIHDVFYAQVLLALGEGRRLDRAQAQAAIDGAPYRAKDAVEAGLIDGAAYEDDIPTRLAELAGEPKARPIDPELRIVIPVCAPVVPYLRYLARHRATRLPHVRSRRIIGVIPVHGTISSEGPIDFGGTATDERLIAAIRLARLDPKVEGVLLHVDSPGGSALASDRIHHELEQLAKEKPLVACLANIAASGGYYIAAPAHTIVAQPTTITGSIGVVAARVVVAPLLARLGVVTEVVQRGARAGMLDLTRAMNDDQKHALERELEGTYRAFIDVVAAGRRQPKEAIEKVAQGRVWTGADAARKKLVDSLGGFEEALEMTRTLVGYDRAEKFPPVVVRTPRKFRAAPLAPPPSLAPAAALIGGIARAAGVDPRTLAFATMRERVIAWSPIASFFD